MRICGMDEAGRGALAGPLVAAGVILNPKSKILRSKQILNDSKLLNSKKREINYQKILDSGAQVVVEIISARQINNRGIGWANKEIFRRLIKRISADKYIVDGPPSLYSSFGRVKRNVKCVVGADGTRKCVMAASIVAKVTRDRLMQELHYKHPLYEWNKNAGYGTMMHIEAIKSFGEVHYHRSVYVNTALSGNRSIQKAG